MINRIKIILLDNEYTALLKMVNDDIRSIPDEIHFILQEEMKRRGLLEIEGDQKTTSLRVLENGQ